MKAPTVAAALQRLNSHLPLAARQRNLPPETRALHRGILRYLLTNGRPPAAADFTSTLPAHPDFHCALQILAAADLVVIDRATGLPLGAYPLTSEPTAHRLNVKNQNIHAMCALDAISVAAMFDVEVRIESECQQSATPICIRMRGDNILETTPGADCMIGIRWQSPSAIAAYSMCMQMVFLRDRVVAHAWQGGETENVSLLTLAEAVAVGSAFFRPLLDEAV